MLIGRSVFPSPCGRSPRADEVMAFGRRTVTMSFSGLRLIFTIGGSAGAVCGSYESRAGLRCPGGWSCGEDLRLIKPRGPRGAAYELQPVLLGSQQLFQSCAGRSLRVRRPATSLSLRAGAPQAADRLCRPNRTGCYAGCHPAPQTAGTAGNDPVFAKEGFDAFLFSTKPRIPL